MSSSYDGSNYGSTQGGALVSRVARVAGAPRLSPAIVHAKPTVFLQHRTGARFARTDEAPRFAGSFDGSRIVFDYAAVIRARKDGVGDVAKGMAPNLTASR